MSTITVGYDGSDASVAALHWAGSEILHRGGTLRVLTCVTDATEAMTDRLLPDPRPVYEMAEWLMQSRAADESGPDVEWSFSVKRGNADRVLTNDSTGNDLLVLGSAGHLLLGAWRLGAITHEILRHAPCPVVLVPAGYIAGGHARVVVGVADSTSRTALAWAAAEARRRQAELVIVHARPDAHEESTGIDRSSTILAEAARFAAQRCETPISTRMIDGPAVPSLLAQAFNADMLVLGARTAGHGSDHVGSIARAVGACATNPTVIVQPEPVHVGPAGPSRW